MSKILKFASLWEGITHLNGKRLSDYLANRFGTCAGGTWDTLNSLPVGVWRHGIDLLRVRSRSKLLEKRDWSPSPTVIRSTETPQQGGRNWRRIILGSKEETRNWAPNAEWAVRTGPLRHTDQLATWKRISRDIGEANEWSRLCVRSSVCVNRELIRNWDSSATWRDLVLNWIWCLWRIWPRGALVVIIQLRYLSVGYMSSIFLWRA